ncbi:unnamed protein product [Echinostoma caproni]|uniref:Cadherin_C domain-containing protein n=1 Tax=Echinostoma caproni TaxID=27848 RepID=A0A3P8F108_9TREM|nr:unnamed protein product [Echinostoma caproni]
MIQLLLLLFRQVVQLQVEDSPVRGNWLLPESELTRTASANNKGDFSEAHTILIVIVLSGISAFLAAVLISAILCMIKPCRGGSRARDSVRFTKGTGGNRAGKYGQDTTGDGKGPGTYTDYNLSILDMNGYAGGIDPATQSRVSHLTAAQIPGLEQLYLPSDKLIGVDSSFQTCSSIIEDASWPGRSNVTTLLGSQPVDRLSPPVPLCEYTITQPMDNNWITTTQTQATIWTPASIGTTTPAGFNTHCTDCHDAIIEPTSPFRSTYPVDTANEAKANVNVIAPCRFLPPLLPDRGARDCAEYDGSELSSVHTRTGNPNRIVTLGIGANRDPIPDLANGCDHRAPMGEEQRSDSGRGASDEEITNQTIPSKMFTIRPSFVQPH